MAEVKYSHYPVYKPSGVDWLGNIPEEWQTIQIGRLFRRVKRTDHVGKQLLSVYRDYGVIPKSSREDNNNKASEDLSPYQLVEKNDLVLNKMKTWQGSIAISEHEGIVSPAYFVYQPESRLFEVAEPKYVHFLLRNPMYIAQYLRRSKGIRVSQWDLDPGEFQKLELLLPSLPEQTKIAAFLDFETGKIDALIAKQERLIELLEEKRQTVISHAVTKGLNPGAPLRPSGIDWLGDVPEHWGTRNVSKLTTKITNGYVGPTRDILVGSGVPYIQATHIKRGKINFDDAYFVREKWSNKHSKSILKSEDVLIVQTGAGTGDVACVTEKEEGYNCHALIILTPMQDEITGRYLAFALRSQYGQAALYSIRTGGMHPHLNCGEVQYVPLPVPPKAEQLKIADFIENQTKAFDEMNLKAQSAITLLKERRTALISAAVTGKIDVRAWQPPQPLSDTDLSTETLQEAIA